MYMVVVCLCVFVSTNEHSTVYAPFTSGSVKKPHMQSSMPPMSIHAYHDVSKASIDSLRYKV